MWQVNKSGVCFSMYAFRIYQKKKQCVNRRWPVKSGVVCVLECFFSIYQKKKQDVNKKKSGVIQFVSPIDKKKTGCQQKQSVCSSFFFLFTKKKQDVKRRWQNNKSGVLGVCFVCFYLYTKKNTGFQQKQSFSRFIFPIYKKTKVAFNSFFFQFARKKQDIKRMWQVHNVGCLVFCLLVLPIYKTVMGYFHVFRRYINNICHVCWCLMVQKGYPSIWRRLHNR